jgi:hypothetical protein
MGKSATRYDGAINHYDLHRTLMGLYHNKHGRQLILVAFPCREYCLDKYYDINHGSDRHRCCDRITGGRNGLMV